jgi:hypothetical protein
MRRPIVFAGMLRQEQKTMSLRAKNVKQKKRKATLQQQALW